MSRRKKAEIATPLRLKELMVCNNVDPFEWKIKLLKSRIKVPKDTEPQLLGKLMKQNQAAYELVLPCYENGETDDNWYFQPKIDLQFRIVESMCRYVYPQLKSTENKTESDMTINVVMKQYALPPSTVTVLPAIEAAVVEEVKKLNG